VTYKTQLRRQTGAQVSVGLALCLFGAQAGHAGETPRSVAGAAPAAGATAVAAPSAPVSDALSGSELDLFKLDSVLNATVVTASGGVEEERALASAQVVTVTQEEIRRHGWTSLAEVLANIPGIYVIDDLVLPAVGVRGITGGLNAGTRIVKVMIDGNAVDFRPELTAFIGPEFIPMDVVDRIEVAKGPLSAVYGANAFLATVNVITRQGRDGLFGSVGAHTTIIRGHGGFGASAVMGYRSARSWVMGAVSADRIDRSGLNLQQTIASPAIDQRPFASVSEEDVAAPISGYLQLGTSSERLGTLSLQGGVQRLDSAGELRLNSLMTHRSRISLVNLWTSLHYKKQWEKFGLEARLGYSFGSPDNNYKLYLTNSYKYSFRPNYDYHSVNAVVEGSYSPFGDRLSLTAGADIEYSRQTQLFYTQTLNQAEGARQPGDQVELIDPNDPQQKHAYDVGAFVQLTSVPFRRLPGLHLTGSLRVDKIAVGEASFDPQLSWRAAIAYRWTPRVVTKIFAGRAFQTPSAALLFGHPGFGTGNNVIGNLGLTGVPPLRPQVINSVEAAFSAGILRHLALEGGIYLQDLEDKIAFAQIGADFVAANEGRQTSVGFELSPRLTYGRYGVFGWGSLHWNLPGATTANLAAPQQLNPPTLYPTGMGAFGIDVDVPEGHLHCTIQARVVGPRGASQSNILINNSVPYDLPTYGTVDMTFTSVGLRPLGPQTETRLALVVRNLADYRWSEPGFGGYDIPSIGRTIFIEAKESF